MKFFGFNRIQIGQNRLDQVFFLFVSVSCEVAVIFKFRVNYNLFIFIIKLFEFLRIYQLGKYILNKKFVEFEILFKKFFTILINKSVLQLHLFLLYRLKQKSDEKFNFLLRYEIAKIIFFQRIFIKVPHSFHDLQGFLKIIGFKVVLYMLYHLFMI